MERRRVERALLSVEAYLELAERRPRPRGLDAERERAEALWAGLEQVAAAWRQGPDACREARQDACGDRDLAGHAKAWCAAERTDQRVLVYRLAGEVDLGRRDVLAFDEPLTGIRAVVVDFSRVGFLCASALNDLLRLRIRAQASGATVHLSGVHRTAARVLSVTDVGSLFPIHPDLGTALAALAPQEADIAQRGAETAGWPVPSSRADSLLPPGA